MAIYYHRDYSAKYGSRNFGDDINPFLLEKLFTRSLIDSEADCVVGIGTILNDRNTAAISHYERKIVFSSGVGYGSIENQFDESWHFVCVRGPKTCDVLGLPHERGICDGAILLADFYPPKRSGGRDGSVILVPHVNTGWVAGRGLQKICRDLNLLYLSPDADFDRFIDTIRSSSLVITEAMHGAILADTMRTPWIPFRFLQHERFKWEDWFASVELPYVSHPLVPRFWDSADKSIQSMLKFPYVWLKQSRVRKALQTLRSTQTTMLSSDEILEERKRLLRDRVAFINSEYGGLK